MTHAPLDALLADIEAAVAAGETLVVFDLDDTLFLTANRHLRILREFAERIEAADPASAGIVRAIERERLRYSVTDTAKEHGLQEALLKDLREFWFARFFKNPYLLEDDVVTGGPAFVSEVVKRGARPVFMTGRDEGMREGTLKSLARHGFPAPDGRAAHLVLKPSFEHPDYEFKLEAMQKLKKVGRVVGTFENEPGHVNLFAEHFPQARHFLLETKHSGKPVTPFPGTIRIRDFSRARKS